MFFDFKKLVFEINIVVGTPLIVNKVNMTHFDSVKLMTCLK
jgi:hypothetical protein